MKNMFSISFRKYRGIKEKIKLFTLIIKMYILFVRAIITSTACVTSVFPSSYRNTVISQSMRIFALGYFLQRVSLNTQHCVDTVYKKDPVLG